MALRGSAFAAICVLVIFGSCCTELFLAPAPARTSWQDSSTFAGLSSDQVERNVAMHLFGGEQKPPPPKEKPFNLGATLTSLAIPATFVLIWGGISFMASNGGS
eukprot:CAMPEP_0197649582 /NCGR_PEP_ID=MMETSP1338-20131121/28918_1 /TAXON_ID=43686 ORGANISM="Pelagodinium beii, Strain RCC1491" /NCGR_SAMPLE_ID=MMETSP1338 /ASSEMBLY_ACC=CAM_ASM_000754 /LENGTH=103 /DNA_ID=CAMNT_0043223809 /DNA_START=45 /DNA_END=356 /DNA_ORIENTATION=+